MLFEFSRQKSTLEYTGAMPVNFGAKVQIFEQLVTLQKSF